MESSRKAREIIPKGYTMHSISRVPAQLNGYEIIAVLPKLIMTTGLPDGAQMVVLGHDPTRRNSKFVTGYVNLAIGRPIREWYWGNYMEDFETGLSSLLRRAGISTSHMPALEGGEKV